MSTLQPETPPSGEHIHLPGPSLQPILVTVGITLTLIGVTLNMFFVVCGLLLTTVTIIRWVGDTRREMAALPEDLDEH